MQWGIISSIFLFSTFKFMFAAIPGSIADIPFWQTYLANISGGVLGSLIFFFGAEFFIRSNQRRRIKKHEEAIRTGKVIKEKKKFTRLNRFVIRLKWKLGIVGITFYAPFFLSIPIGSIIAAKFYSKQKITYPLIALGIFVNGLLSSGIPYICS